MVIYLTNKIKICKFGVLKFLSERKAHISCRTYRPSLKICNFFHSVHSMEGIMKAMNERNLNEGQWEDRKQWSIGVGQRIKTF